LTVNVRDERGDVLVRRQVSTQWAKVLEFFSDVRLRSGGGGFTAILEVCGLHDWLIKLLGEFGCREITADHHRHPRATTPRYR